MNIGIYLYDKAEVLDFSGPYEVFQTARRLADNSAVHDVFLIAQKEEPVIARGDYLVVPHYTLENHPSVDVLIVPGGVHQNELLKTEVIDWLQSQRNRTQLIASVCTGAFLLAKAGLLEGLSVTTHWEDLEELSRSYPGLKVIGNQRWVDCGRIVTSAGISAGIDMSLHLVARLGGEELARKTARQMEYDWNTGSIVNSARAS